MLQIRDAVGTQGTAKPVVTRLTLPTPALARIDERIIQQIIWLASKGNEAANEYGEPV